MTVAVSVQRPREGPQPTSAQIRQAGRTALAACLRQFEAGPLTVWQTAVAEIKPRKSRKP